MPQNSDGSRRRRRSSAEIARLKALRQAHADQLECARANERRVEDALEPFAAAAEAIVAAERRRSGRSNAVAERLERDLASLDEARARTIESADAEQRRLKETLDAETEELRAEMGRSVLAIRGTGKGMPETAAVLGVTVREARNLAACARQPATTASREQKRDEAAASESNGSWRAGTSGVGEREAPDADDRWSG